MRRLTAVDMFCGAGGFTEGFKQQGFEVTACLDNWGPAVETHRKNHPSTRVFQADILEFESSELPNADVLIGSPPCTEFSYANRGGHGDLDLGMRFVLRFLRMVHETQPKYWIMENVPRLLQSLPPRVPLKRLGLQQDGFLEIPVRKVLNSADFGAPQKRLRLVSGNYPLPVQTHAWSEGLESFSALKPWVPVRTVLGLLPDPLGEPDPAKKTFDPSFDLGIPETDLTDHFMDTRLNEHEVRINRKSKTDHSWYGRMAFPDPIDRPARTVMATQTGVSRETLVLDWSHGTREVFRRPSIRECACFQAFPITYQFWGSTAQVRYKLVGNAVPTSLASALARALLKKEGLRAPSIPAIALTVADRPPAVRVLRAGEGARAHVYPSDRRFRDHIAGSKTGGCRIDFANSFTGGDSRTKGSREVHWEARLVTGSGKSVLTTTPKLVLTVSALARWANSRGESRRLGRFYSRIAKTIGSRVPERGELQGNWASTPKRGRIDPPWLLRTAAKLVDSDFPAVPFDELMVPLARDFPNAGPVSVPVRRLAQLVAVSYIAESSNDGSAARPLQILTEQLEAASAAPTVGQQSLLQPSYS